jgi:hypothetical protein
MDDELRDQSVGIARHRKEKQMDHAIQILKEEKYRNASLLICGSMWRNRGWRCQNY